MMSLETELHWYELHPLRGTCPLCGLSGLPLEDDIFIPPHDSALPVRPRSWLILRGLETSAESSTENPRQCPIGRHTQAVEDGGVEVELHWVELYEAALARQKAELDCCHKKTETCPQCLPIAERYKLTTDAWHHVARRWSRENPERTNMPAGINRWRDRKPWHPRTLDSDVRADVRDSIAKLEEQKAPNDPTLEKLYEILRMGTYRPSTPEEWKQVFRLRKLRLVRKSADRSRNQLTPLGIYLVGKYLKGFDTVRNLVLSYRLTHKHVA